MTVYDRTTLRALIQNVKRRLQSAEEDNVLTLTDTVIAGATTLLLTDPTGNSIQAVRAGSKLSLDLEVFYVIEMSANSATVIPGFDGSMQAGHAAGTICYVDSRYTEFDIQTALNDDLNDLSAQGLYRMRTADLTYNPVFVGYDLTAITHPVLDIVSVRFRVPDASKSQVFIKPQDWEYFPETDDTQFPSGAALMIYEDAYPGLPLHITYKSSFGSLEVYTDDVVSGAGLPATAVDLPVLGASIALVTPREVERNDTEVQPDPRKATEVPPGAVMNSVAGLKVLRQNRLNAEKKRLSRQHGRQRTRF